jgi:hypothetical protein
MSPDLSYEPLTIQSQIHFLKNTRKLKLENVFVAQIYAKIEKKLQRKDSLGQV